MSEWVKSKWNFPDRCAILKVHRRDLMNNESILRDIERKSRVEDVEHWAYSFIRFVRPDLAGCVVFGIRFNFHEAVWEFLVSHELLPKVEWGSMMPTQWLDPKWNEDVQPRIVSQVRPD